MTCVNYLAHLGGSLVLVAEEGKGMQSQMRSTIFRSWIALIASLGGFLQSYVTCIIAGSLIYITREFQLTPFKEGNVASFILIGAIAGSLVAGFLADWVGRKYTLIFAALIYLVTAVSIFAINTFFYLMLLRFATGVAVGITSILVPIYLAEVAPPARRGAFVSLYQFSVTLGTVVAYVVNLMIAEKGDWRMMFFVAAIPAAFQLSGFFLFPESPRWLLKRGKAEQAKRVMDQIGGNFETVQTASEALPQESLFSGRFFFLIAIALVLSAFQQLSGINAVIYFTPKIFAESGFSDPQDAIFATVLVGITTVVSTFLTIFLVDRFGRRKLLLISQFGVLLTLLVLIVSFSTQSSFIDMIAVGAVILYVFSYSLGLGPIVWVLLSEIFPQGVRAKALALCTLISWMSNYFVVLSFPGLIASLGTPITFGMYGLLSLFAYAFYLRYIPETKGKSLEQLEKLLVYPKEGSSRVDK